jgi:putative ABC transport system permease protein
MFVLTYLRGELRHRASQALLVAAGLAIGVGLVIATVAASAAIRDAQIAVLRTLSGIGTDITVAAQPPASHSSSAPGTGAANRTGLSVDGNAVFDASTVDAIARMPHVAGVADSLVLNQISPPSADSGGIPTSTRIEGIDVSRLGRGPYASATLRSGRSLQSTDAHARVAVVDTRYAAAHRVRVGSAITIAATRFSIVGVVDQPTTGAAAIYLPLAAAQQLPAAPHGNTLAAKVNTIYVSAASAAHIQTIETELAAALPGATLTSSDDLAKAVSGSLASAANLARNLATWLTIGVLLTTAAATSLLTLGSLARRTRELGTLKALGWTTRRIILQINAESATAGLAGIIVGTAIGYIGVALINAIAPKLTATIDDPAHASGSRNLVVHLHAHTNPTTLAAATVVALAAALAAAAIAAWRTAQFTPAHALAQVE